MSRWQRWRKKRELKLLRRMAWELPTAAWLCLFETPEELEEAIEAGLRPSDVFDIIDARLAALAVTP